MQGSSSPGVDDHWNNIQYISAKLYKYTVYHNNNYMIATFLFSCHDKYWAHPAQDYMTGLNMKNTSTLYVYIQKVQMLYNRYYSISF